MNYVNYLVNARRSSLVESPQISYPQKTFLKSMFQRGMCAQHEIKVLNRQWQEEEKAEDTSKVWWRNLLRRLFYLMFKIIDLLVEYASCNWICSWGARVINHIQWGLKENSLDKTTQNQLKKISLETNNIAMRVRKQASEILLRVKLNCTHSGVSDGSLALLSLSVRSVETTTDHVLSSHLL